MESSIAQRSTNTGTEETIEFTVTPTATVIIARYNERSLAGKPYFLDVSVEGTDETGFAINYAETTHYGHEGTRDCDFSAFDVAKALKTYDKAIKAINR